MSTAATGKQGTLIPASKKLDAPSKRLLRIVTVCATPDEFVNLFGELVDDTSIYIVTRHPLPVGTRRLVRVQLKSGDPVMRADGEIIESHANSDGPGGQNGMRVKLLTMDERTHAIHKKLLVRAATMARQQMRPPPLPAEVSARIPVAVPTPVAAPTAVAPPPPTAAPPARPLPGMTGPPPKTTAPYPFTAALPGVTPPPAKVDPDRPIVPANPFAELHPSALEHFVECTLYEETAPHDLREIDAQIQREQEKEKELEKSFGGSVDQTRGIAKIKRVPSAVWSGLVAAVVGVGAGWLMRGNPPAAPPAPKPAPAIVAEAPKPAPEAPKPAAEPPKPAAEPPKPAPPKPPPPKCTASIASLPSGADVTWGEAALGKTPLEGVTVPCGEAVVKVDTGTGKSPPRELHVAAEADHPAQLVVPFGKFAAQLELRSKPPGAAFSVDGVNAGASPTDTKVPIGRRVTVTATLAGHKPWSQKVLVKKKKQFVDVKLSPE